MSYTFSSTHFDIVGNKLFLEKNLAMFEMEFIFRKIYVENKQIG
jgi:hypothetical protein